MPTWVVDPRDPVARLADYIFGKKNVRNEKMAMTTPVQMDRDSGAMSPLGRSEERVVGRNGSWVGLYS